MTTSEQAADRNLEAGKGSGDEEARERNQNLSEPQPLPEQGSTIVLLWFQSFFFFKLK